jgi:hypothetical protein
MKYFNILLALCLLSTSTLAQESPDTTKIQLGDLKVLVYEDGNDKDQLEVTFDDDDDYDDYSSKEELTHWGGIDLGVNVLMNADMSTDLGEGNEWLDLNYARSLSWNFNIIEQKIRLAKDYVGIITGLGLSYNSYGLGDSVVVASKFSFFDADTNLVVMDSTNGFNSPSYEFTKNKLRTTHLKVPLMLEFNTSKDNDRSFHVAAGVIGGWRIGSITKQKYQVDGDKRQDRNKADFNMNTFTLDASVRVGFRNFTVFANYALTPLFEDGKGPEVYPATFGLALVPW